MGSAGDRVGVVDATMSLVLYGITPYIGTPTRTLGYYESFTFLSEKYDKHSWSDKPRNWRWFHKFRKFPPPWLPPLPVIQATCRHTVHRRGTLFNNVDVPSVDTFWRR